MQNAGLLGIQQNPYHHMSSELMTGLIIHQALAMDQQLQQEYPELEIYTPPLPPSLSHEQYEQVDQTDVFESYLSEEASQPNNSKNECSSLMELQKRNKTKLIKQQSWDKSRSSNTEEPYKSTSEKKKGRKGQGPKKPPYPTKNFLPNFKRAHLDFLIQKLGEKVKQHSFIKYLQNKLGISLEDYTKLYNLQEFRDTFAVMFKQKYLYRMLLLSRSELATKKIHHRKLFLFNKAFQDKNFTKIN